MKFTIAGSKSVFAVLQRAIAVLVVSLAVLAGISMHVPTAQAQLLPGMSSSKPVADESGLQGLLDKAREDGSTVIVVRPGDQNKEDSANLSTMRAERFLAARERIREIISSAPTLWENIKGTIAAASPDGTYLWLLRAVGTAILGLVVGWYVRRPMLSWAMKNIFADPNVDPETSADKIAHLLYRAFFTLIYVLVYFAIAIFVAILLDSGHEPSRRVIFEILAWYCVYRFLRHGVSWNLFAGAVPRYRIVNLSDKEAIKMHRDFHISVAICAVAAASARFLSFTGVDQITLGLNQVLTIDHIKLLQIFNAVLVVLVFVIYLLKDWKPWQRIFSPADPGAGFYGLRTNLAKAFPVVMLVYSVVALAMFVFRLALDMPSPGVVIAAPFVIFYLAIVAYGIALIVIRGLYNRRNRLFQERAAAERLQHQKAAADLDVESGEEMIVGPAAVQFEYQPIFRSFFESAALIIILVIALGQLGQVWGVDISDQDSAWNAMLDIVLAGTLCWIAYLAVSTFIDRKLEEERGEVVEIDDEIGGEGGGAGASRMATLLPILRYVLVILIFSIAAMVILSRMGVDVAPLFAGAGVVGIAVGFGAQTLIRDIFSGAFFLMDDAFRKGEYVEIEGIKGTVEKISIRSFQLRHHLGALHTIPFGEIKQLTNYSRDWVLMKLPLRVTYDTDVEKVRKLVKKLGQSLLDHPQVGHTFMQPLKSQGVYKMEDSAMIIRVKFMTKPGEQFVTRKVVYESIQDLFSREGIHFAHKEVTVRLADGQMDDLSEQEKKAVTAAARSVIDAEEEAAMAGAAPAGSDR